MGEIQIWQKDGVGTDDETLRRIIREFRENGVQGINSQQSLSMFIERMGDKQIDFMLEMDEETTLQILVDCVGAVAAFRRLLRITGNVSRKEYNEASRKYRERIENAQKVIDEANRCQYEAERRREDAEERIRALEFEVVTLKAKLYDTYEAIHEPTEKSEAKGAQQKCRMRTEQTQSGSWG